MARIDFDSDEVTLAELSPSRRSLLFPVLEVLLITGVVWLGIGFIDAHFIASATSTFGYYFSPPSEVVRMIDSPELVGLLWLRRGLLVLWVIVAWRRCVRHMVYRHRARIICTDRRLIVASGHWRSHIDNIPLHQIVDARARGTSLDVFIAGARLPYQLHDVPHAKRVAKLLQRRTRQF